MDNNLKEFLSVKEASEYLKQKGLDLKPDTLRKKVQRREIPYYDLGKPKFKIQDLDRYIESKRVLANRWPLRRVV